MQAVLSSIERAGNKLPHPFILFAILAGVVVALSALLASLGVSAINPQTDAEVHVRSLLSAEGIEFMLTSVVSNFVNFPPLGLILVVMFGIGLADKVGLMSTLMQVSVAKAPPALLTFCVFMAGICGSIASDANYLILIPLAAMVYHSVGRHPIAGAAAAYAAAGAGFDASLFITVGDALFAGITTEAARLVDPEAYISPVDNYFFVACSVFVLATVGTLLIDKVVEPRLQRTLPMAKDFTTEVETPELTATEKRGLKRVGIATLVYLALVALVVVPEASPLRNAEGGLIPSPFLRSLVPLMFVYFVMIGLVYGITLGKITSSRDVPQRMAESASDLAPTLVLFFAIAQFIAYFRWSELGQFIAIEGSNILQSTGFTGLPLVGAFIVMSAVLNVFMTSGSAQWALMAPVFVPMLMMIDFDPAFVLAMFRIGDSSTNIISPMSPYFSVALVYMQRYKPDMGLGTLIATMLPMALGFLIAWSAFLMFWLAMGWPIGPGIYMMAS
ncbi:AbgT family transporter [Halomonas icarae]|uniref:p-aminobenzoyl-glutamate transporter n=1 Tax=Halomonas icarae TaxID=2691040 RepID=A0A7X4W1G1_9GAMM|nr:AbgT family transporter [Halomonas icarae]MDR5902468.1 AbgT family transporter [Halomonas icarae]NAW14126.1 p-aminobenzoyl-glutamate transporter [Halomonas icarae]